ncbi:uncharacterized protein LOC142333090 isoform X1 [Lycorma delicatula]|uniref:uncharacterized protein LOC142333090 isoform X1 n=2 Tax=Lycorma delicatula TaxID=130591 RepID=UPI003F515277
MRKVNELNNSLAITASILNEGICLVTCINLYYFIEVSDGVLKLKSMSVIFVALSLLLLYTSKGQDIVNEIMLIWRNSYNLRLMVIHQMLNCLPMIMIIDTLIHKIEDLKMGILITKAVVIITNVLHLKMACADASVTAESPPQGRGFFWKKTLKFDLLSLVPDHVEPPMNPPNLPP